MHHLRWNLQNGNLRLIFFLFLQFLGSLVSKHELLLGLNLLGDEHLRELALDEIHLGWQLGRLGVRKFAVEAALFAVSGHKVELLRAFTVRLSLVAVRSEEGLNLVQYLLVAFILVIVLVAVLVDLSQKLKLLMEHLCCLTLSLHFFLSVVLCVVLTVSLDQTKKVYAELFAHIQIEPMLVEEKLEQLLHQLIRDLAVPDCVDQGALRFPSTKLHPVHVEVFHGQEGVENIELSRNISSSQGGTEQVIVIGQF